MSMQIDELDRRVSALEAAQYDTTETLRWVVAKLARVSAVQDEHTLRFDRIESEIKALRRDFPKMAADAMREVLKERQS